MVWVSSDRISADSPSELRYPPCGPTNSGMAFAFLCALSFDLIRIVRVAMLGSLRFCASNLSAPSSWSASRLVSFSSSATLTSSSAPPSPGTEAAFDGTFCPDIVSPFVDSPTPAAYRGRRCLGAEAAPARSAPTPIAPRAADHKSLPPTITCDPSDDSDALCLRPTFAAGGPSVATEVNLPSVPWHVALTGRSEGTDASPKTDA
mmetsp:Transcript_8382/g.20551  ORF Transcript_8382/g.20551 Transcript_8382/m.20551 type:complete len:205 (-) Transcript_8382:318-932(-)